MYFYIIIVDFLTTQFLTDSSPLSIQNRALTCSSNLQHGICKSEQLTWQTHETCLTLESRNFPHLLSAKILTSGKFKFSVFWDAALRSR